MINALKVQKPQGCLFRIHCVSSGALNIWEAGLFHISYRKLVNRTVSRVVDVREITADERHGIEFLETPATYYDNLLDRVGKIWMC